MKADSARHRIKGQSPSGDSPWTNLRLGLSPKGLSLKDVTGSATGLSDSPRPGTVLGPAFNGQKALLSYELLVLGVLLDVVGDERAEGNDLEVLVGRVGQRDLGQATAETAALA